VRLALDDFGTGYSSLSWLRRLPVDQVKIDKGFVSRMTSDPEDAIIVQTVIDLAGNLTIETVAEGVEDEATMRQLRALGCQLAQGHHLSPPMPTHRLPAWLAAWPAGIVDLGVSAPPPRHPRAAVIALPDRSEPGEDRWVADPSGAVLPRR
jgi:sensor c-di-GMP phosphodiesterase-like protein